jgi:hypothetical protein
MVRNAVLHKEVKTESPKGLVNKTYEGFLSKWNSGHTFMVPFQGQMLFPTSCGYSKFSTCRLKISP